jgi:hypothetical protein
MIKLLLFLGFLIPSFAFSAPAGLELRNAQLVSLGAQRYTLSEYHRHAPPAIGLLPGATLISCRWQGHNCGASPWVLSLVGPVPQKNRQTRFELAYRWKGKKRLFELDVLADNFPYMTQTGRSVLSLPLIFSVTSPSSTKRYTCHLVILAGDQELVFYRQLPIVCDDFRPHQTENGLLYSYQEVQEGVAEVGLFGNRVILSDDMRVLKRIDEIYDGHEFILLSPDHWIGMEVLLDRLSGGAVYLNKRLRERKNGAIVFDWGVSDFIKQTNSEGVCSASLIKFKNEVVVDLVHMNSIQILNADEWLVGLGHSGVGLLSKSKNRLEWIFGGFADQFSLTAEQASIFLHTPIFNVRESTLYLFSNRGAGALVGTAPARVLKYELDVPQRRVKTFSVLRDQGEVVRQMGGLQIEGDVLSISFGSAEKVAHHFVEMKGDIETWSLSVNEPGTMVYRFYRRP